MPYSGPRSPYSMIGKTEAAYFKKINAEGGVDGRMIELSHTTVRLQSAENVGADAKARRERPGFVSFSDPWNRRYNTAIQSYLNEKKIHSCL